MEHYDEEIIYCVQLFLTGTLSAEQRKKLEEWLQRDVAHQNFFDALCRQRVQDVYDERYEKIDRTKAWNHIVSVARIKSGRNYRLRLYRWAVAVVLPIVLAVGGYWGWTYQEKGQPQQVKLTEIHPGKQRAILRLNDNRVISLSGGNAKRVEVADGIQVKNDTVGIVYPKGIGNETEYNTLEVPRGGEYSITLSDGSVVYLNSGSKLRYPIAFGAEKREVYLSGEGYFSVSKDADRPFLVVTDYVDVKVYGTSFNLNTYRPEKIQTVLVEGSISVRERESAEEYRVSPGELACYDAKMRSMKIRQVKVYPYIAWKDRIFVFEDKSLEEIMDVLSLWYNVDVFFQVADLQNLHFTGHLGRYENISSILEAISEVTRVKFSIKGRTIIVTE